MRSLRQISRKHCMKATIWHVCIVEKPCQGIFCTKQIGRPLTSLPPLKGSFSLQNGPSLRDVFHYTIAVPYLPLLLGGRVDPTYDFIDCWVASNNMKPIIILIVMIACGQYLPACKHISRKIFGAYPAPAPHFYKCSFSLTNVQIKNWAKKTRQRSDLTPKILEFRSVTVDG